MIGHGLKLGMVVLSVGMLGTATRAGDPLVGVWWSPKHNMKFEVVEHNGTISGRCIAVMNNAKDSNNPDPALRSRPLLGLVWIDGFHADAPGKLTGGTIYDPEGGGTYNASIWMEGPDRMMMRGYIGLSLFGRTAACERVAGPDPGHQQPGEPVLAYPSDQ